eukprot:TRINITY_DN1204_c1_g2_i1.p1 TRINITY_DN1204_c1_g2~~TRINITY_DN1204_c1_g2_i1.p1  ORF type:complete len:449 (+),score=54.62 TRINITY_DN1204_c1_g2_i1:64-1410(+)
MRHIATFAALCVINQVTALHSVVKLDSDKPWQFIGKFTYAKTSGEAKDTETLFSWDYSSHEADDLELRGYVDIEGSWSVAESLLLQGGTESEMRTICLKTGLSGSEGSLRYRPSPKKIGQVHVPGSSRTHVWYFYLARSSCVGKVTQGEVIVDMTNPGGFFSKQFSSDKNWILECLIAVVCTLVAFAGVYTYKAVTTPPFHPVMQHYLITIGLQIVASGLLMAEYLQFASSGVGNVGLVTSGQAMDTIAHLMFLLLILVFAMGFKVVEVSPLKKYESLQKRRKTLAVFFVSLVIVHVLLLIAQLDMNAWDMSYPYTTVPGILLAILRVPILGYYAYSLRDTLKLVATHHTLFITYGFAFGAQILLLPVLLLVAVLIDPWVRFKTVFMSDILMRTLLLLLMGVLLWPGEKTLALLSSGYEAIPLVNDDDKKPGIALDNYDDEKSEDDGL